MEDPAAVCEVASAGSAVSSVSSGMFCRGVVFGSVLVDMRSFVTIPQLSSVGTVSKCWALSQVIELCVNVDNFALWKKVFVLLF